MVTLSAAGTLGPHLVDARGASLYFFVNDTPGTGASACAGPCLALWPAFDAPSPVVGSGLSAADFGRFDRGSGVFQTTWRGRPLYYFSSDTAAAPNAGEGFAGGRWFVARAYDLFFASSTTVTPQGAAAANAPFITDGSGRSLYVFQVDTRGVGGAEPTSACTSVGCSATWPAWQRPAGLASPVLPSTILATDVTSFTSLERQQFAYKGWPLYYYATDDLPGEVAGHAVPNWRAVNGAWSGAF